MNITQQIDWNIKSAKHIRFLFHKIISTGKKKTQKKHSYQFKKKKMFSPFTSATRNSFSVLIKGRLVSRPGDIEELRYVLLVSVLKMTFHNSKKKWFIHLQQGLHPTNDMSYNIIYEPLWWGIKYTQCTDFGYVE